MRSLFVSTQRRRFRMSASLRKTSVAALVCGVVYRARSRWPLSRWYPPMSLRTTSVTQSTTTTVTTNAPVQVAPLPPAPDGSADRDRAGSGCAAADATETVIAPVQVVPQPFARPAASWLCGWIPGSDSFNGPVVDYSGAARRTSDVQLALPLQLPPPPVFVQPPRFSPPPR